MKKGTSLIEVLTSSVILFISITGIMQIFSSSKRIEARNTRMFTAERVITGWFERLNTVANRDEVLNNPDFGIQAYVTKSTGIDIPNGNKLTFVDTLGRTAINYDLEFNVEQIEVKENNDYAGSEIPSLLRVTAIISWGNGQLAMSSITK